MDLNVERSALTEVYDQGSMILCVRKMLYFGRTESIRVTSKAVKAYQMLQVSNKKYSRDQEQTIVLVDPLKYLLHLVSMACRAVLEATGKQNPKHVGANSQANEPENTRPSLQPAMETSVLTLREMSIQSIFR